MALIQSPEITDVDILVQPAEHVAVNEYFRYPIIVSVKVRGLTFVQMDCARTSIGLALFAAEDNSAEGEPVEDGLDTSHPAGTIDYPTRIMPSDNQNGVHGPRVFTLFYYIDDLVILKPGHFFLEISGWVTGHIPALFSLLETQKTRTFTVHAVDDLENIPTHILCMCCFLLLFNPPAPRAGIFLATPA